MLFATRRFDKIHFQRFVNPTSCPNDISITYMDLNKMIATLQPTFSNVFTDRKSGILIHNFRTCVPVAAYGSKSTEVQVRAWRRAGENLLHESMMGQYVRVERPQSVKLCAFSMSYGLNVNYFIKIHQLYSISSTICPRQKLYTAVIITSIWDITPFAGVGMASSDTRIKSKYWPAMVVRIS